MALHDFERDLGTAIDNLIETHVALDSDPKQVRRYLKMLAETISVSADRIDEYLKSQSWPDRI